MLVDPDFLLRVHRDRGARRQGAQGGLPTRPDPPIGALSDLEVASRLSFFLWSSIPDERLLDAGRARTAHQAGRCSSSRCGECWPIRARPTRSCDDFAAQWLNLRRVDEVVVHPDFYPEFRRQSAARRSSRKRSCSSAARSREDRSVLDLLRADYTFVNERLARHYGIPGIYGSRFRRVTLPNRDQRGGLLAQRRAAGDDVVSRSHVAGPARQVAARQHLRPAVPPPPPGVDTNLPETKPGAVPPTIRERLAQHRRNPVVQQLSFGDRSARASRSRISTSSAAGGPLTNRASRSMRAARR